MVMCRTQRSFIPLRMRAELALNAVNGMAYLHEMKIVHFDLKPDNLLLDGPILLGQPDAPTPSLKVADFGLSKHKWSAYVSGVRDLRSVGAFYRCVDLCRQALRLHVLVYTLLFLAGRPHWCACEWRFRFEF